MHIAHALTMGVAYKPDLSHTYCHGVVCSSLQLSVKQWLMLSIKRVPFFRVLITKRFYALLKCILVLVLVNNTELSYHASPMYSNHGDKGWYGIEWEDEDGMGKPGHGATQEL